ncbi:MAG: SDR family oxidoreductase [Cyanobacteria bacterium P01_D01_bin.105]
MASPVVLITGCSSGIGKALCFAFQRQGYRVVATARQVERLADLQASGMRVWALDVNDQLAVETVVPSILAAESRLDILVNNAGFGQFGPLMDIDPIALQQQFQTNVFAPLALAQQVAPTMKAQGSGLIVNIGSISGVVTTPFAGAYCASKAALHSVSDALRMELSPFNIQVVTVQPGAITSHFGKSAENSLTRINRAISWYAPWAQTIRQRATLSQVGATPANDLATALVTQLSQPNPPSIIRLGKKSFWLPLLKKCLPNPFMEYLLRRKFGLRKSDL